MERERRSKKEEAAVDRKKSGMARGKPKMVSRRSEEDSDV